MIGEVRSSFEAATRTCTAPGPWRWTHAEPVLFYVTDHLGSTILTLDATGAIESRAQFTPFGEPGGIREGPIRRHGFAGGVALEESGVLPLGPRLYDPEVGRFLSPDPLVADPANPQSFNRYSYALDNPFLWIDPSGLAPEAAPLLSPTLPVASVVAMAGCAGPPNPTNTSDSVTSVPVPGADTSHLIRSFTQSTRDEPASGESQSGVGDLLNEQYEILDEIGNLEEQLESILYELRGVYEQFDRVTNTPRGDERATDLVTKAYATNFWLGEINRVRERADPILERLSELDRELYANRQQILRRSTSDYRVLNESSRRYPPFPDRFMDFNSRVEAIRRETLGSP